MDKDKIWLAGFMDGEGSFYVAKTTVRGYTSFRPRVSVVNTHQAAIDHAEELFGRLAKTTVVRRRIRKATANRKARHGVDICSWEGVYNISKSLLPYLVIKREAALTLIDWAEYRLPKLQTRKFQTGFDETDVEFYERLRVLNKRGT